MEARDVPAITARQATLLELLVNGTPIRPAIGELMLSAEIVLFWCESSPRFAYLIKLACRPDGPERWKELIVLNHELTRAELAARYGSRRAGEMLAGSPPDL
jgi:hypothetical protein